MYMYIYCMYHHYREIRTTPSIQNFHQHHKIDPFHYTHFFKAADDYLTDRDAMDAGKLPKESLLTVSEVTMATKHPQIKSDHFYH